MRFLRISILCVDDVAVQLGSLCIFDPITIHTLAWISALLPQAHKIVAKTFNIILFH